MLPTHTRSSRTTIPATGLGSILVATPQLALVADRGVVADVAVAVGMGGAAFSAVDRRPWPDATRSDVDVTVGAAMVAATAQASTPAPAGSTR